jgi:CHAT domain-containing protein
MAIEEIGPKLWSLFAGTLDAELKAAGVKDGARLIVLPQGALGLLPLDLARDPERGRSFAETYEITNIPSLEAYLAGARTAAKASAPSLAEAVNPTGDLPSAEVEGAIVASHFKGRPLIKLDHASATPDVVLAGLKGKSYWHFASHGQFDWKDARETGLVMKDREVLTVGALLDARGGLGAPRLAVLSACETGLYDAAKNPDEFVGLPTAFLELGAAGVIGSLWQVDDRATALLMARFYDFHIDEGLPPPAALKQAKAWLRNATNRELTAYAQTAMKKAHAQEAHMPDLAASLARRGRVISAANGDAAQAPEVDPNEKQFAHPYYWSGFVYTGV